MVSKFFLAVCMNCHGGKTLYCIPDRGEPMEVVKSLTPVWNNFVFFEVNALSFHQVSTSNKMPEFTSSHSNLQMYGLI